MDCPSCHSDNFKCTNSRPTDTYIRRRRECLHCGERWTTVEITEKEFNLLTHLELVPAKIAIAGREITIGYFPNEIKAHEAVKQYYQSVGG